VGEGLLNYDIMKNLLFIFLLIPFFVLSQGTLKITADTTSIWRVSSKIPGGDCWDAFDYTYYFKGDTTINNLKYKKLYSYGVRYKIPQNNISCDTTITHFTKFYVAAIRDTVNKVFLIKSGNIYERLLYDFGLSVGDSLPVFGPTTQFIDSIDNILINGVQHKRFFSKGNWIIKGIGSSFGLIEPINVMIYKTGNIIYEFQCFGQHDSVLYSPNGYCELNVGINKKDVSLNLPSISIYPNPANNNLYLHFKKSINKDVLLSIYNSLGKLVKQEQLTAFGNEYRVNIGELNKGIYFVKFTSNMQTVYSSKFIKK